MEAKKSKATEKKPNQESADSPDPDSQVDTNNNSVRHLARCSTLLTPFDPHSPCWWPSCYARPKSLI